jgi:hypothetical protein
MIIDEEGASMKTNTSARNNVHAAKMEARSAATSKWMSWLARFGYAIKGIVYLIVGALAIKIAVGSSSAPPDQQGALQTIYGQPFGKVLLLIVAIGLFAFALWSFIQAIFDTEGYGKDAKGIISRLGYAATGVGYAGVGVGAYHLATGTGSAGKSLTATTQDGTALLLQHSYGVAVVVIIGLIVIGIAIFLFIKAYQGKFRRHLNLTTVNFRLRNFLVGLGRFGYAAMGVVYGIIGIFLIVAALQHNPGKAKGLDTALLELARQPFGMFLLAIVALGFIAYGVYSFVEARYRRVGRG